MKSRKDQTNNIVNSHSNDMSAHAQVYSYPPRPNLSEKEVIEAKKEISKVDKDIRHKIKRDACLICEHICSGFCCSHSIPRFVLENIGERGYVSAPRQQDDLEPLKKTGIGAAGVFYNICHRCDNNAFQVYEEENKYRQIPSDELLKGIAIKNYLKWIYTRSLEVEGEKLYEEKGALPVLVKHGEYLPTELDIQEYKFELYRLLPSSVCESQKMFHLQYYKELDYRVPIAAQYLIAMLVDIEGNLINDIFSSNKSYHMEYLHVAIFPLEKSSVIILFTRNGQTRHRRFIRQLKKLSEIDQLSVINYLTFSGADNVFLNPIVYQKLTNNVAFLDVCRMTYSVKTESIVPNTASLRVVKQAHSFSNRYRIPNLLAPEYALV